MLMSREQFVVFRAGMGINEAEAGVMTIILCKFVGKRKFTITKSNS
jgi:hypothetical protein